MASKVKEKQMLTEEEANMVVGILMDQLLSIKADENDNDAETIMVLESAINKLGEMFTGYGYEL
jgi:transcriptional regulator CtsR